MRRCRAANICSHIAAKLLHQATETYGKCYGLLAEKGILPQDLATRLRRMAGFRNLLVHGYGKVDDRQMLSIMRLNLGDLEEYLVHVTRLIVSNPGGGGSED